MYSNLNKFVLLISLLVCCEIAGRVLSGFLFCRIVQGKGPRHTDTDIKLIPIEKLYSSSDSTTKTRKAALIIQANTLANVMG